VTTDGEHATETLLDVHFFRPIADALAKAALPTPLPALGVAAIGLFLGLCGASLLRYENAKELIPAAILLLLHAVLQAAAGAVARARGDVDSSVERVLDAAKDPLLMLACGVALARPVSGDGGGVAWALVGLGSAMLQGALSRALVKQYLARAADPAYVERLAPVARGWAYLGPAVHWPLMAVFICAGGLTAYLWLRLTLGNLALALLLVEGARRERALAPPAAEASSPAHPIAAAAGAAPPAPEAVESARKERAPISWRPPPE
jgi:hypothetical protein